MTTLADVGRVTLVGGGNMGGAMLDGWLAGGMAGERVELIDPGLSPERRERWDAAGVRIIAVPDGSARDILVLSVKPQIIGDVLSASRELITPDTVVVSVAAGVSLDTLRAAYGPDALCVRAMPNTPAQVRRGMTVCCATEAVGEKARAQVSALMAAIGAVEWVADEALMDAVTGVSGSGPAYLFHMVEALAAAGEAAGLPKALAETLARETVCGAGELMHKASQSPEELRRAVTSPNGTTQAGLEVLMPELSDLMRRTVAAAAARSKELG